MLYLIFQEFWSTCQMVEHYKPQGKFAIAVGLILLMTTFSLLFVPTWVLRWYAYTYETERQAYYLELAQSLEGNLDFDNSPQVHFYYQDLMRQAGQTQELPDYYQKLIKQYPDQPSFVYYLARLMDDDQELLQDLPQTVPAAFYYQSEKEFTNGFYLQAFMRLEQMSDSWIKYHRMALAAARMDEVEIALSHFKAALNQPIVPPMVEVDYAEFLYFHQIDDDNALFEDWSNTSLLNYPRAYALKHVMTGEDILTIFNESPLEIICTPASLNLMAEEALRQEDLITARILLNRSDQINPKLATTKALFGILAQYEDRVDTTELMSVGLNANQYPNQFHVNLAHVLNRWKVSPELPYRHFMKAWNHPPEHPDYLLYHANQIRNQDPCKAAEFINHALLFYQEDREKQFEIKQQLAIAQGSCGRLQDEALNTYYELLQMKPEQDSIRMEVAMRLVQKDQANAAINLFVNRLKDEPNNANHYAAIARIHILVGNPQKAQSYLQSMLEQNPDIEPIEVIQDVLAEISTESSQ